MALRSIFLARDFYLELIKETEKKLISELNLEQDDNLDHEDPSHHLWKNYFPEFIEQVKKKYQKNNSPEPLRFPTDPLYFYKRKKEAEVNKLKGINRNFFKLLLIECGFKDFNDVYNSDLISDEIRAKQILKNKFEKPNEANSSQTSIKPKIKRLPIEDTLDYYAGTKWWFYFYGYSNKAVKPLVRLKMFFDPKEGGQYPLRIINTNDDYPSYSGYIRLDESNDFYIVCELKTIPNRKRLLHIKFQIQETPPEIMMGVYNNFDRKNLVAGSILLQRATDDFDEVNPKTYSYQPDKIVEMKEAGIPEEIQYFFNHGMNNSVKMPSTSISTLNEFKDWIEDKKGKRG